MFLPSNITLKFGDSGDFVAELQRRLAMVKCFSEDQVNGFYDGSTVNGVMSFQGSHGLHADGVAGPETLRRLNGVIAGDTSSSEEDKKEEEAQLAITQTNALNLELAQQEPVLAAWGEPAAHQEATAAPALQPVGLDPAMFAPAAPVATSPLTEADRADIARLQNPPVPPSIELAEMLLTASAQEQQQLKTLNQQTQPAPAPVQQPPQIPQPQPLPVETLAPPPSPPIVEPQPVQQAAAPVMAEPQGLVQRAGRFANAMMQKMADYFEAKLPPSVLNEVKAAGQVMAAAGMKEAPIPTGPEMGGQAQLPARGPEQQPAQIR